jgi:ADP-ribosylglycohydrolase
MNNLLISVAIGDIAGMPYEFHHRTKNYDDVKLIWSDGTYTDDTVCTFACAEALLNNLDMAQNLWTRCRQDPYRGYGGRFAKWLFENDGPTEAYNSFGNGSAMRVSAAGFLAKTEEECIELATATAMRTHNHPEGIKGAVATALAIFHAMQGKDKQYFLTHVLEKFYPQWSERTYNQIQPGFYFDETCQLTVPPALICVLESKNFMDSLKLAIALGGDSDTLAAIAAPIAYALYRDIPQPLIDNARKLLPAWMLQVSDQLDALVNNNR